MTLTLGIYQIRQDEPTTGHGPPSVDAILLGAAAQVRAERSGQGGGGVYHLVHRG